MEKKEKGAKTEFDKEQVELPPGKVAAFEYALDVLGDLICTAAGGRDKGEESEDG